MQPWPDYYTVGANIRYLIAHGVSGVFMEGQYMAYGGDMQEMRTWVNHKLMWDPTVPTQLLVDQFLKAWLCGSRRQNTTCTAARAVQRHLDIYTTSYNTTSRSDPYLKDHGLRESAAVTSAYLTPRAGSP